MSISEKLPKWLDDLIFNSLRANYCPCGSDMTVIDWDKDEILSYLGTYFPRSYIEARNIASNEILSRFSDYEELSILDFGSGTGGEIIGLLTNIELALPHVKKINLVPIDGNYAAMKLFKKVLSEYREHSRLEIECKEAPIHIEDFYDFSLLNEVIHGNFDLIITFKAICEFVTKEQFDQKNPYTHIIQSYMPRLNRNGIMIIEDVTTYNNVSNEWLPNMMNEALTSSNCSLVARNEGYNIAYTVRHSGNDFRVDTSKVCWRVVEK